jgi:hypothetical protein
VLNLSTSHASLEQSLVEPSDEFPLLQDTCHIIPCDREELCDHDFLIFTTQIIHERDNSIIEGTPAALRSVHCIENEKEGMELISS